MREGVQPPVQVGAVIDGKYRIEEFVGSGAMSVVALGLHLELEQQVAIKFLQALGFDHEQCAQRFKREARAAARIESEHVARVLDVGTLPEGCPYIVMEHLRGNDLARELASRGPLPAGEVAGYVLQACEALAEAHAAGIVHRDIKPENLFLAERADGSRTMKVLDFGISKSMSQSLTDLSLTGTASFMGSPLYMSPEQMRSSRSVDARTDIWSLGTVMYEMVSGAIPFTAESIPELCLAVIQAETRPLREHSQGLPPGFEEVVARCLEKDRDRRYATVAELAQALSPFVAAGASSAERTGRILALSGTRAKRLTASTSQELRPSPARESRVTPALALAPVAQSQAFSLAPRAAFVRKHAQSVIAGAIGLALGAWWMSRARTTVPEQRATLTAEVREPVISAAQTVRVEPVDGPVDVRSSTLRRDGEPSSSEASVASRATSAVRARVASAALSAGTSAAPAAPSVAASSPHASEAPKRMNAWDPDTFGGRH